MQYDLLGLSREIDLRSNVDLNFQGPHAYVSMRLEHDETLWRPNFISFVSSKVICRKKRLLKRFFRPFLTSKALPFEDRQPLNTPYGKSVQEL